MLAASLFACSEPLPPADVAGLDDDFSGKEIDAAWQVLNASTFERKQEGGKLVLKPTQNTVWYKADQGPGLVKRVTGNFRVSTTVRARKASDPEKAVDAGFQFAGIIARDPASDEGEAKESYVFNVVGYRGDYLSVETKTTKKDVSYVEGPEWDSGDAELRGLVAWLGRAGDGTSEQDLKAKIQPHVKFYVELQRDGEVVEAILDECEEQGADLIVMATDGREGFLDALRGTTTEQVLRAAKCPLLAVPG